MRLPPPPPPPPPPASLHVLLLSILLTATVAFSAPLPPPPPTPKIGVTYTPFPNFPPPEHVANTLLNSLHISAVRLLDPTPSTVRAFSYSNISLILSVPNHLIPSFAANLSASAVWLYTHVLPFHPRAKISLISVGNDAISSTNFLSPEVDPSTTLLPAMRNLQLSLRNLGIRTIPVSTTFSFINIMTTSFPPSSAEFQEPINTLVIRPLLQFLDDTNSSFLVNIYPYNVYLLNSEIPIGYALFQEHPYNYRDDVVTGVRYRNLFDMMVDAVIAAMAVTGHENIPIIVTETGWPSSTGVPAPARGSDMGMEAEAEASLGYAEMYLNGLLRNFRSGQGTPLRKEGVAEAYIYELFDNGTGQQQNWGIMYQNMSMKFKIQLSAGVEMTAGNGFWLVVNLVIAVSLIL